MAEKRKDSKGRNLYTGETQDKEGRYRYRYQDARGERQTIYSWRLVETDPQPNGKKTCRALRTMEKEIERDLDEGIDSWSANKITLNQAFDDWIKRNNKIRLSTRTNKVVYYNNHVRNEIGNLTFDKLEFDVMEKFFQDLYLEKNLSPGSIEIIYRTLSPLFNNMVTKKAIRVNNASLAIAEVKNNLDWSRNPKRALTRAEQDAFVNFYTHNPKYSSWVLLLDVLLGTGMRIGEATSLTWSDIDFQSGFISVNHTFTYYKEDGKEKRTISSPKTVAGNRKIPMMDSIKKALMAELESQMEDGFLDYELDGYSGFVFFNKKRKQLYRNASPRDTISKIVKDYNETERKKASEEHRLPLLLPNISPHILRHTFTSRIAESNIIPPKHLQTILGHSNIQMTMNVYAEISDEVLKDFMVEFEKSGNINIEV